MDGVQLVCASPHMRRAAETIRMSRGRTLLLTGETGVGKDVLARWAHSISPFSDGPFVDINCAAIQETLWESEIFGHVEGAFTGAVRDKVGHVEKAEGGTLFLNEIGEMPLPTQAKLLTFLDTRRFQRVGATEDCSVNTRVIAATNRDLEKAVESGEFRRDLYFRLADTHVHIPPLRERFEDILAIAKLQLNQRSQEHGVETILLPESTKEMLVRWGWEGNTRELISIINTAFDRCIAEDVGILQPDYLKPELLELERDDDVYREKEEHRDNEFTKPLNASDSISKTSPPFLPMPSASGGSILDNPEELKQFLDQFKTESDRWNISGAYRYLVKNSNLQTSRRAFSRKIKQLFPDS